jgi:putative protease
LTGAALRKPELLAPAGTLKNLRYALAYGADAVYAGVPRYSLRVRNNDFDLANLADGIALTRRAGKRFYLAANAMPHGAKLKTFVDDMAPVAALEPDALIMADPGLILLARERWPELPVHLSVQANTTNAAAVRFWQRQGVSRVILSRELSLDEIADIRDACPDMELEVFVHGALCIAYSGRCLLSGYFNHRDANQGTCTNACRWEYRVGRAGSPASGGDESEAGCGSGCGEAEASAPGRDGNGAEDALAARVPLPTAAREAGAEQVIPAEALLSPASSVAGDRHPDADQVWLLEEASRPGEYMPVFEDENGTYIMNAKDLRAVEHVARLAAIGINCLKIEGRTKSHYYAARTTRVYRRAIDDAAAGRPFRPELLSELDGLANRGYTEGFYRRHAVSTLQNYDDGASRNRRQIFVGEVLAYDAATGLAEVDVKNHFQIGDELELMTPDGSRRFTLARMSAADGAPLDVAPGSGWRVWIALPEAVAAEGYGLITKTLA